ncbi:hypothetical protein Trydic_g10900 [Trypoxylus dichotomus]
MERLSDTDKQGLFSKRANEKASARGDLIRQGGPTSPPRPYTEDFGTYSTPHLILPKFAVAALNALAETFPNKFRSNKRPDGRPTKRIVIFPTGDISLPRDLDVYKSA